MNLTRHEGLFVAAAGVAAAFVVMIGTGYRVTRTAGSPIGDGLYFAAIVALAAVIAVAVSRVRPELLGGPARSVRVASRRERRRLAEERTRDEEERRQRLQALAADPVRRKYVERIERGEPWSDEQIEYDLDPDRLATCEHLAPIEREMRAAGIEVRLETRSSIDARCRVDAEALRARFSLPSCVEYAEPQPQGRAFEDPLPALIRCAEHASRIDVVHPLDATSDTPVFPVGGGTRTPTVEASEPAEGSTDPFTCLRGRVLQLARIIDAPTGLIPTFGVSEGNGLPHIEIEGDTYHYVHEERGVEHDRFSTTSVDELLYRIFRDVAWSMSSRLAHPHQKPGEDFRREMFRQQLGLLRRLDPEWESRCAGEHLEVLARHPFVDGR